MYELSSSCFASQSSHPTRSQSNLSSHFVTLLSPFHLASQLPSCCDWQPSHFAPVSVIFIIIGDCLSHIHLTSQLCQCESSSSFRHIHLPSHQSESLSSSPSAFFIDRYVSGSAFSNCFESPSPPSASHSYCFATTKVMFISLHGCLSHLHLPLHHYCLSL